MSPKAEVSPTIDPALSLSLAPDPPSGVVQSHSTSSRPASPSSQSPSSSSYYLNNSYLPPLPFDSHPATSSSQPQPASEAPSTSAMPLPPMIQFDPRASPSDDEDDDDDDADAGVAGRPKKRKSVKDLRSAAAAQSSGGGAGGAGASKPAVGADDEDKGRRKIQIEYIEEKSKRHITFSKRKAGIMKK
ncbi:minichromosome maintenance protein 1, partial [Pseudohyphozyma bogoriensis]